MGRLLRITIAVFSLSICIAAHAQNSDDCEILLSQATDEVNAGHFSGIDSLLMPCLKGGFTREQRQRAYLLLTQVHLLLDEPENAEASYLEVLRANPEFVTDPARDPIDVVYFSRKFTATPTFSLFGRVGVNTTFVNVLRPQYISGEPVETRYIPLPGWTVAAGGNWNVNDRISLGAEFQYAFTAYRKEQHMQWNTSDTELQDRMSWFNVPVTAIYNFSTGKFVPYAYAGPAISYLVSGRANPTLSDRSSGDSESVTPSESPIVNYAYKRKSWNWSFVVGGGLRYKWGLHYLFGDVRYSLGMKNVYDYSGVVHDNTKATPGDNTGSGYQASGEPTMRYGNSDDFFKVNHLYVTVGYLHQLYNPRELRKARTQSVLRKILRGKNGE